MALLPLKIQNNQTMEAKSIEDRKQTKTLHAVCWDNTPENSLTSQCSVNGDHCYCSHAPHRMFWSMLDLIYNGGLIDYNGAVKFLSPGDVIASKTL